MHNSRFPYLIALSAAFFHAPPLYAAGTSDGGYISDAPIPWHMTQDEEGRNVIELIEMAEERLGLELTEVVEWTGAPGPVLAASAAGVPADAEQVSEVALVNDQEMPAFSMRLAIPYQSLIYWADGSTWIYGEASERHYTRLPVEVWRIEGDVAILAKGPAPGTRIVTFGAAELFGAETGTGH